MGGGKDYMRQLPAAAESLAVADIIDWARLFGFSGAPLIDVVIDAAFLDDLYIAADRRRAVDDMRQLNG